MVKKQEKCVTDVNICSLSLVGHPKLFLRSIGLEECSCPDGKC